MGKLKSKIKEKLNKDKKTKKENKVELSEAEEAMSKKFKKVQVIALICFALALIVIVISLKGSISIDGLTSRVKGKPVSSFLLLLLLFAIKSLTIVIPLPSLYIASGALFPPVISVLVSYAGLAVTLTIPYILGRWAGAEAIEYLKKKYPKLEKLIEIQERNEFFANFIIRLIGWLPCDVLSFYFGSCKTSYPTYIIASLLGASIGVITNTLLGDLILNPLSKEFALLMLVKIIISIVAFFIAYSLNKDKK